MNVGSPEYKAMIARADQLKAERGATKSFEVGKSYQTNDGDTVTCVELSDKPGYETARFDGGEPQSYTLGGKTYKSMTGWRYNRDDDRGRVTGTAFDHSDPRCVIPEAA